MYILVDGGRWDNPRSTMLLRLVLAGHDHITSPLLDLGNDMSWPSRQGRIFLPGRLAQFTSSNSYGGVLEVLCN